MRQVFIDPVSGRTCELVLPAGGKVFPGPDEPKIGVRHQVKAGGNWRGCPVVADLCIELDAFFCPACHANGRVPGAWARDVIAAEFGRDRDREGTP